MIQWILVNCILHDAELGLKYQIVYVCCSFPIFFTLGALIHGATGNWLRLRQTALVLFCGVIYAGLLAIAYHFYVPSPETSLAPDFIFDVMAACAGFYAAMHKMFHRPPAPPLNASQVKQEAQLDAILADERLRRDRKRRPWMYHREPFATRNLL